MLCIEYGLSELFEGIIDGISEIDGESEGDIVGMELGS